MRISQKVFSRIYSDYHSDFVPDANQIVHMIPIMYQDEGVYMSTMLAQHAYIRMKSDRGLSNNLTRSSSGGRR